MTQPAAPPVVGSKAAAVRLGLSHSTVLRRIRSGQIAATKTGEGTAGYVIAEDELARLTDEAQR